MKQQAIAPGAQLVRESFAGQPVSMLASSYGEAVGRWKAQSESPLAFDWDEPAAPADKLYEQRGQTAVIKLHGTMVPDAPEWMCWYYGLCSCAATERALAAALADPEVDEVLLDIDSPGGRTAGVPELAEAVFRASKPVRVWSRSMIASAAYWVASQAESIKVGAGVTVGSIGVFVAYFDLSTAVGSFGAKLELVRAGDYKGVGMPGLQIQPEDLVPTKAMVDHVYEEFVRAVARGRGLDEAAARALATGRVWIGHEALTAGLVDYVGAMPAPDDDDEEETMSRQTSDLEAEVTTLRSQLAGAHNEAASLRARSAELEATVGQLRTEVAAREDLVKAKSQEIETLQKSRKQDLLRAAQSDGRLLPSMVEQYAKMADKLDVETFAGALAVLPKQTRPTQVAGAEPGPTAPAEADADEATVAALELKAANKLGISVEQLRSVGPITVGRGSGGVVPDGKIREVAR